MKRAAARMAIAAIWKLIATLSDGSQHSVWVQLK